MDPAKAARLAAGTQLLKYCNNPNQQPHLRVFRLDVERRVVTWSSPSKGAAKTTIHIEDIQEVRRGQRTARFAEFPWVEKENMSFSIIYGASFMSLDLICNSEEERDEWVATLLDLMAAPATKGSDRRLPILQEAWERITGPKRVDSRKGVDIADFLRKAKLTVPRKLIKQEFGEGREKAVSFDEVVKFYERIRERKDLVAIFQEVAGPGAATLSLEAMRNFCVSTQKMTFASDKEFEAFIRPFCNANKQITVDGFVSFLEGTQSGLYDPSRRRRYQDMSRPFHEYYIYSSHNTYLSGHQLTGKSSVEAYARALLLGCRCIELDCWDGPNNQPLIYHGHTLTTRIAFADAIKTINEYAFRTSDYPVILSIENHCSVPQQVVMVRLMSAVFGDRLVQAPLAENEAALPSPEQLRFKILLKAKIIQTAAPAADELAANAADADADPDADAASYDSEDDNDESEPSETSLRPEGEPPASPTRPRARTSWDALAEAAEAAAAQGSPQAESGAQSPASPAPTPTPSESGPPVRRASRRALATLTRSTQSLFRLASAPANGAPRREKSAKPKQQRIAEELSAIVAYCRACKLRSLEAAVATTKFNEMVSLSEKKLESLAKRNPDLLRQLSRRINVRTYPAGSRVDSSNYDPRLAWSMGCQMVALNFQTPDRPMHLNMSKFEENGRAGYVLKPDFLRLPDATPPPPVVVTIQVLSAHQLPKPADANKNEGLNAYVELEVLGEEVDTQKVHTDVVPDNGWNPTWGSEFTLNVEWPDFAFVRASVYDSDARDASGRGVLIGSYAVPVRALGQGYRNVPLWDAHLDRIPFASLFVHVDVAARTDRTAPLPPRPASGVEAGVPAAAAAAPPASSTA